MMELYIKINIDLTGNKNSVNISLKLFHKVPARAIETLFDYQNQPLFKRVDLGKYQDMEDIKHNLKDFLSHYTRPRSDLEMSGQAHSLERIKNPHEMAVRSKTPKTVALVKWLIKKGLEKIQEQH